VKTSYAIALVAAALSSALVVPPSALSQNPVPLSEEARAARARANAQNFENNAREITVFDRQGKVLKMVGPRAIYNQPIFSPDGTRIAVIKTDLEAENSDVWITDISSGKTTRITTSSAREGVRAPVWSPDGSQVAYVASRSSREGLYRNSSNGEGKEELLYELPGAGIVLTDWSLDGRFLNYYAPQLGGNILFALPLAGERQPIEIARSESQLIAPRLSPDSRFVAYRSNESGRNEIWVRSFAPSGGNAAGKWQVSPDGGLGMVWWKRDGRELYYLAPDRGIMAVDVNTTGTFTFGKPTLLFKLPDSVAVTGTPGGLGSVSRDGQQVAFIVPRTPDRQQITVLDRLGKITATVGEPGFYAQPKLSPDDKQVAVLKNDRDTGRSDIWTFDIATGKGTQVTAITNPQNGVGPPMWSPDGSHILYSSTRGSYTGIYRKPANGTGNEELLFRYTAGAGLNLTDVSPDGKFLTFTSGGVVFVVPLTGSDPLARQALEFSREEYDTVAGRFSRDGRFMAYGSNEADPERSELFVRPFDASAGSAAGKDKWQISKEGASGMVYFRQDGREIFWVRLDPRTGDGSVMASEISTTPAFQAGTPRLLFKLPNANQNLNSPGTISRDGQRFVFTMNVTAR
jgi:Tol biopolymer transport system component